MRIFSIILLILLTGLPLFAQDSEQTVEELYLQSPLRTQVIRVEAQSPDRDLKMLALTDIEKLVQDGEAADDPEIFKILSDLAGQGVTSIVREEGYVKNDFPEVRREAARLLGLLGTPEAVIRLETILVSDPEPMVASEAIASIAKMDVDDKKSRNRAMSVAMYRQTAVNKDNNFAYTFLESVNEVASREGGLNDLMIFEEVAKIADAHYGYNRKVRERALKLLQDLQNL